MLIGLVKWFDIKKGFGVITTPDKEEFFLHINDFESMPEKITIGLPLIFLVNKDKSKQSAKKSRLVGLPDDWKIILNGLDKPDTVNLEVKVSGVGKWGNPFVRKETLPISLIDISLKYFFRNNNDLEILNQITCFFDKDLPAGQFISYCDLIESKVTKNMTTQSADAILKSAFGHFGENLNEEILYEVWRQRKFKYIGHTDKDDYEIPLDVLTKNITEIGITELNRIISYSFGIEFCSSFINEKFERAEDFSSLQIKDTYQYLDFLSLEEQSKRKLQLDAIYIKKFSSELLMQAKKMPKIKNRGDFNSYIQLLNLIPDYFSLEIHTEIKSAIESIIVQKCTQEFKPELWIEGFTEKPSFESIAAVFQNNDVYTEKRTIILSKLPLEEQFELLQHYAAVYGFEKTFTLIEAFVKKQNALEYYFDLSEVLFDSAYWNDKKGQELIPLFNSHFEKESSHEQKYDMFFKGFYQHVPQELVYLNIDCLSKEQLKKILDSPSSNKEFISKILPLRAAAEPSELSWLYHIAADYLDSISFSTFDSNIAKNIPQADYFALWEIGQAKVFPTQSILEMLNDQLENYSKITYWIANSAVTTKDMSEYLLSNLDSFEVVTDRKTFYKQLHHIQSLLLLDESYIEKIKALNNEIYNLMLWSIDKIEELDFEQLQQKFIYFEPERQVRIIRKLFWLKSQGIFDLTIEKLNQLTRFDLDLYKTTLNFNNVVPIDISTDAVIKALSLYNEKKRFIVENELMALLLDDLKFDQTRRFKFAEYFDKCSGRQTAKFNWSREGEIKKVHFGDSKFYFAISFNTGETKWENNRYGGRDVFHPNPNFENLKQEVKQIPGVKWNAVLQHWGVPSQYETEVKLFAQHERFFLDFEGSTYTNNLHLIEFVRINQPAGISFCEGRLANKPHETFKRKFWWCGGQPCFSKCETIHQTEDWEKYTLLDFCEILGLDTDETNKMGDFIPKGRLNQFTALINRFNRLLDKLYCQDCSHILYPSDFGTSNFASNNLVRFKCRNESCSNNEEIYLNHCLNGQCNCIIDSRVSKKCSNGLFICNNCGSCCSHSMLQRRLTNLELTGGYIHQNLIKSVTEKLGHLERADYFCYICASLMPEVSNQVFQCPNCRVSYDTAKYKFKRPHIHLKEVNISISPDQKNTENDENLDIPF